MTNQDGVTPGRSGSQGLVSRMGAYNVRASHGRLVRHTRRSLASAPVTLELRVGKPLHSLDDKG